MPPLYSLHRGILKQVLTRLQRATAPVRSSFRRTPPAAMAAAAPAAAPADLQRRAKQLGVELEPLHKNFGVQVKGLDLTRPLSEEQQAFLLEMWRVHDLLLFRGQELSPADEQRALLYFPHDAQAIEEERFCAPFFNVRVPSHPLVRHFLEVRKRACWLRGRGSPANARVTRQVGDELLMAVSCDVHRKSLDLFQPLWTAPF